MRGNSRVNDIVIGIGDHLIHTDSHNCPHPTLGFIMSGSPNVQINGARAARNGDVVMHDCPHCSIGILLGTSVHKVNGISQVLHNDISMGSGIGDFGVVVSSSPNTLT